MAPIWFKEHVQKSEIFYDFEEKIDKYNHDSG